MTDSLHLWRLNSRLQIAAEFLKNHQLVAYPTEAVWGLGCDPFSESAVSQLLQLKSRPVEKGLILLFGSLNQAQPFLSHLSTAQQQQVQNSWPGPITWLVPKNHLIPDWISGHSNKVALRVTDHPVAAALALKFGGPIVSTSCNPQGKPPARSRYDVQKYFAGQVDFIAPGTVGKRTNPSEIRDLESGKIVRPS